MKNYIYLFLAIFGLPIFSQAQSQEERCKTEQIRAYYLQKDPSTLERRQAIENFTQDWIRNNQDRRNSQDIITIPVVVHVVYVNATQNISEAQIQSQITVLNEDFRKQNGNFSSTPAEFQSLAADTEIEFCLASRDPEGNSTNGITRTATTVNDIGDSGNDIHYTAQGGKDAWDATRYLNIWVCAIDGGGTLGYATVPGQAPATEDGVVNDYRYFGTMGTVEAPFNLGRTATHEVGHYLNLEHIWGIDGGCEDDDLVSDTPDQDFDSFGCPSHPQNSCGSNDMFVNYMDYSDDACMTMFTEGQKARMLAAINGPRAGLLSSTGCGAPLSVELHHFKATCNDNAVSLSWETTRELEHQQFNIQKSKDAKDFITVASLKNNQPNQTNKQYEWKDNSPLAKNYYRLEQINQDGTSTFSDVINTACGLVPDIKLFPNPTQEEFTISLTSFEPLQTLQIQIFDIHGKMIYQMEQVAASEIEVVLPNPIHEGLYFIHLLDDGQSIYQSRLVKQ